MQADYPFPCILLSGMPCTGKDTLSHLLMKRDASFALLRKHRADPSFQARREDDTYIHISVEAFEAMAQSGGFLQFHRRYGRMYGVSKEEYTALIQTHRIPIIHVGKYENLRLLREGGLHEALSLLLWSDRAIVQSRLVERHVHRTDREDERLMAYDQEVAQLKDACGQGSLDIDLVFVNNSAHPDAAADALLALLRSQEKPSKKEANHALARLLHL